jgi:predicted chitinase
MQDLWLQQFSNASIKGQDIRSIDMQDENSFIELFKYATKETTKDGATYSGEVLHTIYNSIQGLRIYQTYGSIRKVKKPIEAEQEQTELSYLDNQMEIWYFEQDYKDWITATGELLIDTISIQHQIKNKKLINLPL